MKLTSRKVIDVFFHWFVIATVLVCCCYNRSEAQQGYGQPPIAPSYGQQIQGTGYPQVGASQALSSDSTQLLTGQQILNTQSNPQANGTFPPPVAEAAYPKILENPLVDQYHEEFDGPIMLSSPKGRSGFFQGQSTKYGWLPSMNSGDFGFSFLEESITFGISFPTRESPMLITPLFAVYWLDGPNTPDMPSRLHDASIQFRYLRKITDRFAIDLAISPSLHSDFQKTDSDAFRLPGRGLVVYQWSHITKVVMGVAYYDREDIKLSPVGGLIIEPSDCLKLELIFPTPKIAYKSSVDSKEDSEGWHYLSAEFGGGSYSIRRASGLQDIVTLQDYRLIFGHEKIKANGSKDATEIAYIFARELDYKSATPTYEPGDTLMIRFISTY